MPLLFSCLQSSNLVKNQALQNCTEKHHTLSGNGQNKKEILKNPAKVFHQQASSGSFIILNKFLHQIFLILHYYKY